MKYSDNPTVDELTNIIRGMGIDYTMENVSIIMRVLNKHTDEDIASAIFRYTDLVNPTITKDDLTRWQAEMEQQPWKRAYSREYCLDIVKNVPVKSLDELFSNADKVREWLEGGE